MVHVPFFNLDLPEPKLAALIPDTVSAVVQVTTKALEYGHDLLYPPTQEDIQAFNRSFEETIPREFDRVRKRHAEGRIVNDEQLSSELEDASFDWYRRQLRTSVIGATDEEMEDVAARKLGLAKPSLQAAVQEQALAEAVAAAGGVDLETEVRAAAAHQATQQREAERRNLLAARAQRIAELRLQVRPTSRQALSALTNASGGMLLGVLLFKSVFMATRRLFRKRKPQQRPQPQRRQQPTPPPAAVLPALQQLQQQRPQQATFAAPQAAAAARQQAAAAAQKHPQGQQQGGKGQAGQAEATTTQDAAAARKTRAIKKR